MITKMEKNLTLANSFISDTDKQTLIDIYEVLIIKNLKEVHQIFQKFE